MRSGHVITEVAVHWMSLFTEQVFKDQRGQ